METVTLQAEDFRTVHNALCDLRSVQERLTGVISNELADHLHSVVKGFESGLKSAYAQDSAQFESKMDYYSRFQKDNGLKTVWSIYELPIHGFLGDHPFQGALQVAYRDHWGDEPVFAEIQGTTWADLYRAADQCIRNSGDDHHCFIEQLKPNPAEPLQLILQTGS
jgi:hypothetical protein